MAQLSVPPLPHAAKNILGPFAIEKTIGSKSYFCSVKDSAKGFIVSAVLHALLLSSVLAWTGSEVSSLEGESMTVSLVGLAGSGGQGQGASGQAGNGSGQDKANKTDRRSEAADSLSLQREDALSPPAPTVPSPPAQSFRDTERKDAAVTEEKIPLPVKSKTADRKKADKHPSPKNSSASEKAREKKRKSAKGGESEPQMASAALGQGQSPLSASGAGKGINTGAPGGAGGIGQGTGTPGGAKVGGTGSGGYLKANYNYILKHIHKHLRYPRQAEVMQQTGTALYRFYVEKSGKVSQVSVKKSTNFPLLDKAGEKAIKAASPLPPPPEPSFIDIPIHFTLK